MDLAACGSEHRLNFGYQLNISLHQPADLKGMVLYKISGYSAHISAMWNVDNTVSGKASTFGNELPKNCPCHSVGGTLPYEQIMVCLYITCMA